MQLFLSFYEVRSKQYKQECSGGRRGGHEGSEKGEFTQARGAITDEGLGARGGDSIGYRGRINVCIGNANGLARLCGFQNKISWKR